MNKLGNISPNQETKIKYTTNDLNSDKELPKTEIYNLDTDSQYVSALLERQIGIMKKNKTTQNA